MEVEKIRFRNATEVLSDDEMLQTVGGKDDDPYLLLLYYKCCCGMGQESVCHNLYVDPYTNPMDLLIHICHETNGLGFCFGLPT